MNRLRLLIAIVLCTSFVVGCGDTPAPRNTGTPTPAATPTPVTFAEDTARAFLQAWSAADYAKMYALLAPSRQAAMPADQFAARYKTVANEATIKAVTPILSSSQETGNDAVVQFTVTYDTYAAGVFQQTNVMNLRREESKWGVVWTPGLIFSQLIEGGSVKLYPLASSRGSIFDFKARPLAVAVPQVVVEVVPAEMKNEGNVLAALGQIFGKTPAQVKAMYSRFPGDWRTAIGTLTSDQVKTNADLLAQPGIRTDSTKDQRTYPHGQAGAHILGYVGQVSADDLETFAVKGYREGDQIGKTGLELWGESSLAGQRGGKLVVLGPTGAITATLANVPARQSASLYTTLDADLMDIADKALGQRNGAVVVMDITNGNVLAMISHPAYDPNKMAQRLTTAEFRALLNDTNSPLLNRTSQSAFPPRLGIQDRNVCRRAREGGIHRQLDVRGSRILGRVGTEQSQVQLDLGDYRKRGRHAEPVERVDTIGRRRILPGRLQAESGRSGSHVELCQVFWAGVVDRNRNCRSRGKRAGPGERAQMGRGRRGQPGDRPRKRCSPPPCRLPTCWPRSRTAAPCIAPTSSPGSAMWPKVPKR